jgi:hypothetical protein
MGAAADPTAVVDPELRLRGLRNVRIADASIFPTMTSVNPVVTVLMIGERAADLIAGTLSAGTADRPSAATPEDPDDGNPRNQPTTDHRRRPAVEGLRPEGRQGRRHAAG